MRLSRRPIDFFFENSFYAQLLLELERFSGMADSDHPDSPQFRALVWSQLFATIGIFPSLIPFPFTSLYTIHSPYTINYIISFIHWPRFFCSGMEDAAVSKRCQNKFGPLLEAWLKGPNIDLFCVELLYTSFVCHLRFFSSTMLTWNPMQVLTVLRYPSLVRGSSWPTPSSLAYNFLVEGLKDAVCIFISVIFGGQI